VISGLTSNDDDSQKVFHAGTTERDGQIVTEGGRVLCVTALGKTVTSAQTKAYELAQRINWKDVYYRRDIGYRAIARESTTWNLRRDRNTREAWKWLNPLLL
jgi:phosphoribosylamine--glycine ligase